MAKEDLVTMTGTIIECMPNATFKILVEDTEDTIIFGTISGKIRKNRIKILQGDKVDFEMSPYDLTKGRIVFRYK